MAMTGVDLFLDAGLRKTARDEHRERVGDDFVYRPLVGDRPPPLDYRAPAKSER